jgi:hypothetical protein
VEATEAMSRQGPVPKRERELHRAHGKKQWGTPLSRKIVRMAAADLHVEIHPACTVMQILYRKVAMEIEQEGK